jgi:hypothetical protein
MLRDPPDPGAGVTRVPVVGRDDVPGLRGLASLTEPGPDEAVAAVVDVAVIGARGDGKTQLIAHAIRTLRAAAPDLEGAELALNREVMGLVMNARAPRPVATAPGVVPHYVFRVRPGALVGQLGWSARAAALGRAAGLGGAAAAGLGGAAAAVGAGIALGPAAGAAAAVVGAAGGALGWGRAARRVAALGEIEIALWDVAGEHVYSDTAADYFAFLDALVRARRRSAGARVYAFAPVLLCNPLGLGDHVEGSAYARLRELLPMFAALDPGARALVAINRWAVVDAVCASGTDRDERVAIATRPRDGGAAAAGPLPVVVRDVVRQHCRDAEDGREGDLAVTYLRYDAGARCEARVVEPEDWAAAGAGGAAADCVVEYGYSDGPGSFSGEARRVFLGWLAALALPRRVRAASAAEAQAVAAPAHAASAVGAGDVAEAPVGYEPVPVPAPMTRPILSPEPAAQTAPAAPDEVWARRGGFDGGT